MNNEEMRRNEIKQFNIAEVILYHLLPGVPILLFAILFANPNWGFGAPILLAIMFAIVFGLIPVQLLIIHLAAKRQGKKLKEMISFTEKTPPRRFILWSVICFLIAGLMFTFFSGVEHFLWRNFSLMPDWLRLDKYSMDGSNVGILWLTVAMNFIFNGILGPVTEELYFRGFLLPRMNKFGKSAPLINTILFSLYHFFSPWEIVTRILSFLPIAYTVWSKKNIRIGIAIHCSMNLIGCIGMIVAAS